MSSSNYQKYVDHLNSFNDCSPREHMKFVWLSLATMWMWTGSPLARSIKKLPLLRAWSLMRRPLLLTVCSISLVSRLVRLIWEVRLLQRLWLKLDSRRAPTSSRVLTVAKSLWSHPQGKGQKGPPKPHTLMTLKGVVTPRDECPEVFFLLKTNLTKSC